MKVFLAAFTAALAAAGTASANAPVPANPLPGLGKPSIQGYALVKGKPHYCWEWRFRAGFVEACVSTPNVRIKSAPAKPSGPAA